MNLSRWGFLRLLGALAGAAQGLKPCSEEKNPNAPCWSGSGPLRLLFPNVEAGGEPKCKEGEERCPLGHYQEPDEFWVKAYRVDSDQFRASLLKQHACTVCGIVYVPRKEGKS